MALNEILENLSTLDGLIEPMLQAARIPGAAPPSLRDLCDGMVR